MGNVLFLRAEREADGSRTFKLIEGEPLPTSFGEDLYNRIFCTDPVPSAIENAKTSVSLRARVVQEMNPLTQRRSNSTAKGAVSQGVNGTGGPKSSCPT